MNREKGQEGSDSLERMVHLAGGLWFSCIIWLFYIRMDLNMGLLSKGVIGKTYFNMQSQLDETTVCT